MKTVAKRFREPGNTDEEIKKMEAKERRSAKKELKSQQAQAHAINIKYLVDEMKSKVPPPSTSNQSNVSEGSVTDELESPEKEQKRKEVKEEKHMEQPDFEENYKKDDKKKKKELKAQQAQAHAMNMEYLVDEIKSRVPCPSISNNTNVSAGSVTDKMVAPIKEPKPKKVRAEKRELPDDREHDKKDGKKRKKEMKAQQAQAQAMNVENLANELLTAEEQSEEKV